MRKVIKFVTGKRNEKKEESTISPIKIDNCSTSVATFLGKDKNITKLHKAAWQGNLEKLKVALKKTGIDAVDSQQQTALHFAIAQGHPNIVWFLLENNAKTTMHDNEGRTPLLKAIELGHKECVSLLLEGGANINETDNTGNTGLHLAVKKGFVDLVETLLKKGAATELSNKAGEYVVHAAIKAGNLEILNLFINNKAGVNVLDKYNRTPLMLAAKTGNRILVTSLIEFGAELTITDLNGNTAEDYALLAGHKDIAKLLKNLTAKKKKTFEIEKENKKFKKDLHGKSFLTEMENRMVKEKDRLFEERKIFCVPKLKKNKAATDNEINQKEYRPEIEFPRFKSTFSQSPPNWDFKEVAKINEEILETAELKKSIINKNFEFNRVKTEKFDNGSQLSPKCTVSLDRKKKVKIDNFFTKRRFSLIEAELLKSLVKKNKMSIPDLDTANINTFMLCSGRQTQKFKPILDSQNNEPEIQDEELAKNKTTTRFSPLGVIFKEIQKESESLTIQQSVKLNFPPENCMDSTVITKKQNLDIGRKVLQKIK